MHGSGNRFAAAAAVQHARSLQITIQLSAQDSSYWCAMLACISRTCVKCDDGTGCGRPREGTCTSHHFEAIQTFYCALSPAHGSSQTAASILQHHSAGRAACEQCRKGTLLLKDTVYSHLPVVLPLLTYAQQVMSAL